ncbi:MAG: tRNA 2-thiouridine(34) synthase MnmA [Evtepia sp.]
MGPNTVSPTQSGGALIAMSGGVDSSIAAYLTMQTGCPCLGATMRLYRNIDIGKSPQRTCCAQKDIDDASQVAFQLDLPYEVLDLTARFRAEVMDKFVRTYEAGGTPNPCIDCNRSLKFDTLLALAREKGLSEVVTGHYARIVKDEASGRYVLKKALDRSKDQSYVLYTMTQDQLAHTRFPLGERHKDQIRELATELGFPNAQKQDSQDICFVPDGDYGAFLEAYTGKTYPTGDFLDENGQPVGTHRGAVRYTLGQRKRLGAGHGAPGLCLRKGYGGQYRLRRSGVVAVSQDAHRRRRELDRHSRVDRPLRCKAKTRYRQQEEWATVTPLADGKIQVTFDEPQRAMTVGQAVVLYDGDTVLGGGTILSVPDEEQGETLMSCCESSCGGCQKSCSSRSPALYLTEAELKLLRLFEKPLSSRWLDDRTVRRRSVWKRAPANRKRFQRDPGLGTQGAHRPGLQPPPAKL